MNTVTAVLRPITPRLSEGLVPSDRAGKAGRNQEEMQDATTEVARVLTVGTTTRVADLPPRVERGRPAGQHFGIGGVWARAETPQARPAWVEFSKAKVCGKGAPCTTTSVHDADTKYAVGPVYVGV